MKRSEAVRHHIDYSNAIAFLAKETHEKFRELISHPLEKGRILEHIAVNFLRRFLPTRYSLGYGFVVNAEGKKSRQIDIVIYDAIDNVPIFLSDAIGIFPVECVFAAIEVKTKLDKKELRSTLSSVKQLRSLKGSKEYMVLTHQSGKTNQFEKVSISLAPRTYIFCYDTNFKSLTALRDAILEEYKGGMTHIHGVYVIKKNWFIVQKANTNPASFFMYKTKGTEKFIINLIKRLRSFPMAPAAMENYFEDL